jgi:hypothetical protein
MTQPIPTPSKLPKASVPAVNAAKKVGKDLKSRGIFDWLF